MITNQILQSSLNDLKGITRVDLGLFDLNGEVVVATANMQGPESAIIVAFAESAADSQMIGSFHLLKVKEEQELIYILVAQGFGEDT